MGLGKFIKENILLGLTLWLSLSLLGSLVKALPSSDCDREYPIDYILYTKLFCEIKR